MRDLDESNHKLLNLHFSIRFIGRINCGKIFFVDVNGVRARSPSLTDKLLSDLDRFDTERCC